MNVRNFRKKRTRSHSAQNATMYKTRMYKTDARPHQRFLAAAVARFERTLFDPPAAAFALLFAFGLALLDGESFGLLFAAFFALGDDAAAADFPAIRGNGVKIANDEVCKQAQPAIQKCNRQDKML